MKSSTSAGVHDHGYESANSVNRRSNASLDLIVDSPSIRDFCCRSQPVNMPSKTAAGSSKWMTPSTRTSPAEPGTLLDNPHQPVNG